MGHKSVMTVDALALHSRSSAVLIGIDNVGCFLSSTMKDFHHSIRALFKVC